MSSDTVEEFLVMAKLSDISFEQIEWASSVTNNLLGDHEFPIEEKYFGPHLQQCLIYVLALACTMESDQSQAPHCLRILEGVMNECPSVKAWVDQWHG